MNKEIIKKAKEKWNSEVDEYNQWDDLDMDEKMSCIVQVLIENTNPSLVEITKENADCQNCIAKGNICEASPDNCCVHFRKNLYRVIMSGR